jgi:hypothetical protein
VLETWTSIAGSIAAAGFLITQIREELSDLTIRNSRARARAILGIGQPRMEAAPCAGTQEPLVGQGKPILMTYSAPIHYPAEPVYIRISDDTPKKTGKSGLSRRDRALLAADVIQRCEYFRAWSVARVAKAFGASPRSTFQALKLSAAERDDVQAGRRPLFEHRTSIPEPTPTPAQYLERAIAAFGLDRTLALLAEAESMVTADVTDTIEEAA